MSAAIFQSELASLIQESKKKSPDIRYAAEKSLAELKALRITSENQLAGDLFRKPAFAEPFILACNSRRAKLVNSGVICLQRLAASHALPSTRLSDVLEAFRTLTSSTFDVQIKILQTLPSLLQAYPADFHGHLLFTSLEICGLLQSSKAGVLSSTAAATLQQLISNTFERLADENGAVNLDVVKKIDLDSGTATLTQTGVDAFQIFEDLCRTAEGAGAKNLKIGSISPLFVLDLLTAILTAEYDIIGHHAELLHICRRQLVPSLLEKLSANPSFPTTIRILKLLLSLISRHLDDLTDESQTVLALLIHLMETDSSQGWRRAACAEVLRSIMSDFSLLRQIFVLYDSHNGHSNIVGDMMAACARIAAEKPTAIGLGLQSMSPADLGTSRQDGQDQASLQTSGMEGVIGSAVTADSNAVGISLSWSTPKVACLEQLDKHDAPSLPDTYIYSLALECLSCLSDGLAKYIMPLSLPRNVRKKSQPHSSQSASDALDPVAVSLDNKTATSQTAAEPQRPSQLANPLKLRNHPQEKSIKMVAAIVTSCWPAFLAACTTFLRATLDSELYHNLVRAIQKLTQVAGVLELSTPRDALLTILGKAAVPSQGLQTTRSPNEQHNEKPIPSHHSISPAFSSTRFTVKSIAEQDFPANSDSSLLTTRNLLCLRAQLNLGIALGPTLSQEAWSVVLETLQQVEHLSSLSSRLLASQRDKSAEEDSSGEQDGIRASLSAEVAAVQIASKKMFASTTSYENVVFLGLVRALLSLSITTSQSQQREGTWGPSVDPNTRHTSRKHQSSRSTSGTYAKATADEDELQFVLIKLSDIAKSNLQRFASEAASDSGWILITNCLLYVTRSRTTTSNLRVRAAALTHSILLGTLNSLDPIEKALQEQVLDRGFSILQNQVDGLYRSNASPASESRNVDHELHERVIDVLVSIVEQHGENLLVSWEAVFQLASSTFGARALCSQGDEGQHAGEGGVGVRSAKLLTRSFHLVQLVGSDFLGLLSMQDLLKFIEMMLLFGRQENNLNMSLTSTTFFQNLAEFLLSQDTQLSLDSITDIPTNKMLVHQIGKGENPGSTMGQLWLVLLLRLGSLTTDSRFQVRNSAIRVMFRVIDMPGGSMSPHGWYVCLSLALLPLFKSQGTALAHVLPSRSGPDLKNISQWQESTVALVDGSLSLVAHHISTLFADRRFPVFWKTLFVSLECILATSAPAVSFPVFRGLGQLFRSLQEAGLQNASMANPALEVWIRHHPANTMTQSEGMAVAVKHADTNQEAFSAHAEFLIRVHDAMPALNLDQLAAEDVFRNLRKTILLCIHPPYESDIIKIAPEQGHVIIILQLLSNTRVSSSNDYISTLLAFTQIAFRDDDTLLTSPHFVLPTKMQHTFRKGQIPTFVAFSSMCMEILGSDISRSIRVDAVRDRSGMIIRALDALSNVLEAKYTARTHRGDPLLWQKATSVGLNIIEGVASHTGKVVSKSQPPTSGKIGDSSIRFLDGIIGSGSLRRPTEPQGKNAVEADEDHDMAAFRRLSSILISSLPRMDSVHGTQQGDTTQGIEGKFVISVFQASFVAVPHRGDLPRGDDLVHSPLSSLRSVRPGTTKQLVYHIRDRLSYLAIDALLGLTAKFKDEGGKDGIGREKHEALAVSAAPYVVLRIAHTFKCFIADQPLRGPMPMPCRLRAEMIWVLKHCLKHRSEHIAFANLSRSGAFSGRDDRIHLKLLYPLILRVLKVWRRIPRYGMTWTTDEDGAQIDELLHQWMEVCGENWELGEMDS